ncbi:hypothetical protein R1sor_008328 [Riccia sorocarpa]|uniref:Uncharacterized protein n=1 Tax=Riccia sorocarpa TaxID=122646 RepID=A0ABD3HWK9_9MARC
MAPFTSRDKKKAKRDPSPGSREAGEVIPIVPPGESNKTKKTSPGSPEAAAGKRYNHLDKVPQKWTAPELTIEKAYTGDDGKQYITYWTKSNVFAMGWLIREICGDFFIDMSREEKLEYDREKWAMGYPTTSEPPIKHIDFLMVDPTICMRPIESTKRAAKHPDGPRDIKENKW